MKNRIVYLIFVFTAVISFFLAVELILAGMYGLTHNQKLSTLINEDLEYPKKPKEYFKIAIFGGSAALGYNSERGFCDILSYELRKRYPDIKFYIKNYAQCGYPFHRHQVEIYSY